MTLNDAEGPRTRPHPLSRAALPFYFLRHGEADWNRLNRCIGQQDRPLTKHGRAQALDARTLCAGLPISRIFHSPLSRAAETARIIASQIGAPLIEVQALKEACLGVKEGAAEGDPADPFIQRWYAGAPIDGAETYRALGERIAGAVARCLAAGSGPPLIVGHSASYRALRDKLGQPVEHVLHCTPYAHYPAEGGWRIECLTSATGADQ